MSAVELGECVSELVRAGGHCRLSATALNQRAVADNARKVSEKVGAVSLYTYRIFSVYINMKNNLFVYKIKFVRVLAGGVSAERPAGGVSRDSGLHRRGRHHRDHPGGPRHYHTVRQRRSVTNTNT